MALDTQGSAPDQNGERYIPADQGDPAEQTAIEEASVIHLLRVLVAEAAPNTKVSEDAMEQDTPGVDQAQPINDVTCEEAGCLLWDMSASRPVAQVMLRNRALEALEIVIARELQIVQSFAGRQEAAAALRPEKAPPPTPEDSSVSPEAGRRTSQQHPPPPNHQQPQRRPPQAALRILEICLGTLANLIVTQPAAAVGVSHRPELLGLLLAPPQILEDGGNYGDGGGDNPEAAVAAASSGGCGGALYVDDARVLSELFRLFSLALRCQGSDIWLDKLSSSAVLQRVMWVGAATADPQLFARFLDMLVALLHASASASATNASGGAASADAAEEGITHSDETAWHGRQRQHGSDAEAAVHAAAAAAPGAAAVPRGGVLSPSASPSPSASACGLRCWRVALDCGLLELVHQVLMQALRACMPAEEKYSELGGGVEGDAAGEALYGTADGSGQQQPVGGASPPSVASSAGGGATSGQGNPAPISASAGGTGAEAGVAAPAVVRTTADESPAAEARASRRRIASGAPGAGVVSLSDDAAAVATAAAAVVGPVPLSDEAVDAALRLIEELVSPMGPIAAAGSCGAEPTCVAVAATAAASGGPGSSSGAETLLRLLSERGLQPGLMQLLLGLLQYHYDSMQVVEGLLVVLVDLGPAVQQAVTASPRLAAVAARLVELLQDSCYSPADGAPSSVVQLQQGAWYLLAATLRGALAAALSAPAPAGEAGLMEEPAAPALRAQWPSLERVLAMVPELPCHEGCSSYTRACCVAGLRLLELVMEVVPSGLEKDRAEEDGQHDGSVAVGRGVEGAEKGLARLGALLTGVIHSLDARRQQQKQAHDRKE